MSSSGHFFWLLFFGPAKKSDSVASAIESAAGNRHVHAKLASFARSPKSEIRQGANPNVAMHAWIAMLGFAPNLHYWPT
jgi:hypothetical protein